MMLIVASLMMWIPVIGWVAAPVLFVLGMFSLLAAIFRPTTQVVYDCQRCRHRFTGPDLDAQAR